MSIYIKKRKPKTSIVFDTYWNFAIERQNVFFNKLNKSTYPWTNDDIIQEYKFTNAYRASDRVSQYLIKNVIYEGNQDTREVFFRIILFKLFNKIETWEFLKFNVGEISWSSYNYQTYNELLEELLNNKIAIYSPAYIMASGKSFFNYMKKHQNHLKLIELMMKENVPNRLVEADNMEEGFNLLKSYPTIGDFLAYQFITDINYSELTDFTEMEFVKAGPGAKDGIKKCFTDFGDYSYEDIIHMMTDRQIEEFEKRDNNFKNLWGRNLQLIDCQNLFCEVDKYSRIAHPEVIGLSGRIRIKQKYKNKKKPEIDLFYPPKWNINKLI